MNMKLKKGMVSVLTAMLLTSNMVPVMVSAEGEITVPNTESTQTNTAIIKPTGEFQFKLKLTDGSKTKEIDVVVKGESFNWKDGDETAAINIAKLPEVKKELAEWGSEISLKNAKQKLNLKFDAEKNEWVVAKKIIAINLITNSVDDTVETNPSQPPEENKDENTSEGKDEGTDNKEENSTPEKDESVDTDSKGENSTDQKDDSTDTSNKDESSTPGKDESVNTSDKEESSNTTSDGTSSEVNSETSSEGSEENSSQTSSEEDKKDETEDKDDEPVEIPEISATDTFKFQIKVKCDSKVSSHSEKIVTYTIKGSDITPTYNEAKDAATFAIPTNLINQVIKRAENNGFGSGHVLGATNLTTLSVKYVNGKWQADNNNAIQEIHVTCEPAMKDSYTLKTKAVCLEDNHKDKTPEITLDKNLFKVQNIDGDWIASYTVTQGSEIDNQLQEKAAWKGTKPHTLLKPVSITMTYDSKKGEWAFDTINPTFEYGCIKKMADNYKVNFDLTCNNKEHQKISITETLSSDVFQKEYKDGKWIATYSMTDIPSTMYTKLQKQWGKLDHQLEKPMNVVLNYNDATGKWEVAGTVSGQFICVPKLNENTNFKFSNVNLACNTDKSHKAKDLKVNMTIKGDKFTKQYKNKKWTATYLINTVTDLPENIQDKIPTAWKEANHRLVPTVLTLNYDEKTKEWTPQAKTNLEFTCAPEMVNAPQDGYSFRLTLKCEQKDKKDTHKEHKQAIVDVYVTPELFAFTKEQVKNPKTRQKEERWVASYQIDNDSPAASYLLGQTNWGTNTKHGLSAPIVLKMIYDEANQAWTAEKEAFTVTLQETNSGSITPTPPTGGGSLTPPEQGGNTPGGTTPGGTTPGGTLPGGTTPGGTTPGGTTPGGTTPGGTTPGGTTPGGTLPGGTTPGGTTPGGTLPGGTLPGGTANVVIPGSGGSIKLNNTAANRVGSVSPKTGDNANLGLMALLTAISGGGVAAFFGLKKWNRKGKKLFRK